MDNQGIANEIYKEMRDKYDPWSEFRESDLIVKIEGLRGDVNEILKLFRTSDKIFYDAETQKYSVKIP